MVCEGATVHRPTAYRGTEIRGERASETFIGACMILQSTLLNYSTNHSLLLNYSGRGEAQGAARRRIGR